MFGFRIRGAGFRPHFESTCIRKVAPGCGGQKVAGAVWGYGYAISWVKDDAWIRREQEK